MSKKLNILFATFSPWEKNRRMPTNGMVEPMLQYFVPKTNKFVLIDEPHPGSSRVLPIIEIYSKGRLKRKTTSSFLVSWLYPFLILTNSIGTRIPFKVRDFLSVLDFAFRDRAHYDIFIGLESVNAIAGVVLRKFGIVKKVVYYVSDFSPKRYQAGWFNKIYLWLDRIAAIHADYIWDVSTAMMPARIKVGLNPKFADKVVHVPNALYPEQINYRPFNKTEPFSLVFAGTLGPENGPDLAIAVMAVVIKKFPKAHLHLYGGGDKFLTKLRELTSKLSLNKNVTFHGFVTDQIKLSDEIKKYRIGLATYKAIPGSPRFWADATKIRLYLAAGLPVVTTQVPPLGKNVQTANAGLVTKDKPKDIAEGILKLLENQKYYLQLRKNAIKMAKNNTWENTYSGTLRRMGLELK